MQSSLIGKIQKANPYAREPERVTFNEISTTFRGENDTHSVAFRFTSKCSGTTTKFDTSNLLATRSP